MNRSVVRAAALVAAMVAVLVLAGARITSDTSAAQTTTLRTGSLSLAVGGQGASDLEALKIPPPGAGAWTIDVTYDPAVLSVVDCSGGFFSICNPSYGPATVRAAGNSLVGLQGDVVLSTITLSCDAAGASALSINVVTFSDTTPGSPQPIAAALDPGTVTCSGGSPGPTNTPNPAATPTDTPDPAATPTDTPDPAATPTDTPDPAATPTDTPDPAASPTPTSVPAVDSDLDGCTDDRELGPDPLFGGQRDPANFWDFFDPNRDRSITVTDFFAVLARFNTNDDGGAAAINRDTDPLSAPPPTGYHPRFDRGPTIGANAWNVGQADGGIATTDIFTLLAQFSHTCA